MTFEAESSVNDLKNWRSPFSTPSVPDRCPDCIADPFDRILIALAITDDLALVSNETAFDCYGVRRLW